YKDKLAGVILTGANSDGSQGLKTIKEYGGLAIVQDPKTAETDSMPRSAIDTVDVDHIIPLDEIGDFLREINNMGVM
ncbi:MAG: chemotaxis protein CheB, partial [Candidatus Scalindua sp.]|nr:chemotaxis protein CheB [Candidatus Scalindua sp.]